MTGAVPHLPVLRAGVDYESLDRHELRSPRDGRAVASISQANAGILRRDLKRQAENAAALRAVPVAELLEICARAGELFLDGTLPLNDEGVEQSPQDYVETLSATSGLPWVMCRANMRKVHSVFTGMPAILRGLMRGLDPGVLDTGLAVQDGIAVSYSIAARSLGVVLPSNSPGVNSLWIPAIALKVPVVLKPGREEPWTPLRIARALLAAGCPPGAIGFYPTDHEGAAAILAGTDRALLFGDASITAAWAADPRVEIHGPGRSKLLLGADAVDDWREHLDVIAASVLDNGGRSCVNASTIVVPRHADELADALARRLAQVAPRSADDEKAQLSAFASPAFAERIDQLIEQGLAGGGAEDLTARHRSTPRLQEHEGARYLLPTIVRCDSLEHPLGNTEFLFPFASVVEVPEAEVVEALGPSLVVTAITRDPALRERLLNAPHVGRLNLGPLPTTRVDWDQPHEGNLFEHLYCRRAIQRAPAW